MSNWKPARCPISRDQPFGYKHYHDETCHASPEQIEADQDELEKLKNKGLLGRIRRLFG